MHWESWLEKVNTSSDGTDLERSNIDDSLLLDTDKPKKKVPLRMDDDKGGAFDDSGFYNKASWEIWLEKGRWDNPKHDTNTQKEFEAFEKLSKLPKNEVTELGDAIDEAIEGVKSGKLNKNNAIETSHKEGEKKEEWNGKFDNSTTRDGVKDDKAQDEEEPLEELTDGKLEEVEKLKSWEVFLKGGGGTEEGLPHEEGEIAGKKNMHSLTGRYQNPTKHRKGHFANTNTGKDAVEGTPRIPTSRKGAFKDTKDTKHIGEGDVTASAVRVAQNNPDLKYLVPEAQVKQDKGLGAGTETPVKTQEELDKEFYERTQPEPKGTTNSNRVLARRKRKSWELWLEKGVTHEDPTKGVKGGMTKVPITQAETPDEIMEAAKNPKTTIKLDAGMKKSWEGWLEKMQGAGDARYGNQHLTGMEQKPVDDDESIDLSAESDKNNEKQEKTEDKEGKDNKPYKALS